jgi:hypothetical protein
MDLPRYYIVGLMPVKFVSTREGGMVVLKMNWKTGIFEYGIEYTGQALLGKDDVEQVSEDGFIQHVESLRARRTQEGGAIQALYDLMNGMEDNATKEERELRPDEQALLAELRRRTYSMFQAAHPDPVY